MTIKRTYKHLFTAYEGKAGFLGFNIFNCTWEDTDETVCVYDPKYNQPRQADVYKTRILGIPVKFAAVELTNGVWGFYF